MALGDCLRLTAHAPLRERGAIMRAVVVAGSSLASELDAPLAFRRPAGGGGRRRRRPGASGPDAGSYWWATGLHPLRTRTPWRHEGSRSCCCPRPRTRPTLEAALRLVVERGADDITVFGALGGPRLDHLVGQPTAAWFAVAGRSAGTDGRRPARSVSGQRRRVPSCGEPGDIVSLLPLDPRGRGGADRGSALPAGRRDPRAGGHARSQQRA